jgi:hypothetical protein
MFAEGEFKILPDRKRKDCGFLKDHAHRPTKMDDSGGWCEHIQVIDVKAAGNLTARDEIG